MLKLGTQCIAPLRLGEQKINKAYLGDELIFNGSEKSSRLPEGYTEVQYIQSGDGQYFVPPYAAVNPSYKTVIDIEPLPGATGFICGDYYMTTKTVNGSYWTYWDFLSVTENGIGVSSSRWASKTAPTITSFVSYISSDASNRRMKLTVDGPNKTAWADDGESLTISFHTGTRANSGVLSLSSGYKPLSAKLYSLQQYNSAGSLVSDLVPCINPDGVAGMYNLVNDKFYASATSTPFIAGPAV